MQHLNLLVDLILRDPLNHFLGWRQRLWVLSICDVSLDSLSSYAMQLLVLEFAVTVSVEIVF